MIRMMPSIGYHLGEEKLLHRYRMNNEYWRHSNGPVRFSYQT